MQRNGATSHTEVSLALWLCKLLFNALVSVVDIDHNDILTRIWNIPLSEKITVELSGMIWCCFLGSYLSSFPNLHKWYPWYGEEKMVLASTYVELGLWMLSTCISQQNGQWQ